MIRKFYKELPPDLKIILIYLLVTILFFAVPALEVTLVRTVLGIFLLIFVPGYVFLAALFPEEEELNWLERLTLSFGMSIAISPLLALVLNFTPWGIKLWSNFIAIILFTTLMLLIARFRRLRLPLDKRIRMPIEDVKAIRDINHFRTRNRTDNFLSIFLVSSIIISFLILGYLIVTVEKGERYTEFYILGTGEKYYNYPKVVHPGTPVEYMAGIINHEYENINYTLLVRMENDILLRQNIYLPHNQIWEQPVVFEINRTGPVLKLEFLLYMEDEKVPYRDNHIWINSTIKKKI